MFMACKHVILNLLGAYIKLHQGPTVFNALVYRLSNFKLFGRPLKLRLIYFLLELAVNIIGPIRIIGFNSR